MKSKCFIWSYGTTLVLFFVAASLAMATITGCAAKVVKPIKNISDAEMAIKMAIENSASVNAPLDVRIAEDKLQKAREAAKR